jgi:hypothetical protein
MKTEQKNDEKLMWRVSYCSFITVFSKPFLYRNKKLGYVVKTAILKKDFSIDIVRILWNIKNLIGKDINKGIRIIYIIPEKSIYLKVIGIDP